MPEFFSQVIMLQQMDQFTKAELNDYRKNGKGYYYLTSYNFAVNNDLIESLDYLEQK